MASATQQTTTIRKRKRAGKGAKRKAQLRSQGSTKSQAELFGDE